jgi:hypothetical protein
MKGRFEAIRALGFAAATAVVVDHALSQLVRHGVLSSRWEQFGGQCAASSGSEIKAVETERDALFAPASTQDAEKSPQAMLRELKGVGNLNYSGSRQIGFVLPK